MSNERGRGCNNYEEFNESESVFVSRNANGVSFFHREVRGDNWENTPYLLLKL
jgi:hypothetical protein